MEGKPITFHKFHWYEKKETRLSWGDFRDLVKRLGEKKKNKGTR